jgi:hypothetical protein
MKYFWKMRKMRMVGAMMSSAPALSRTTSVEWAPTKPCSAPAMVRMLGSSMSTMASRNWFHVLRNIRTPSEASAGTARGSWMCQNAFHGPAPSTHEDSVNSTGTDWKWVRIQNTAKGMFRPMSGRISPR